MADLVTDVATAMDVGRRRRQEDALLANFSQGADLGLAVLSDGMGGHDDGDLASRILVSEMFSGLFFSGARLQSLRDDTVGAFRSALHMANKRLADHVACGCIGKDAGGTLVSLAIMHGHLRWLSVGDSPLYLLRDRKLQRLNEDHSMAPQIDLMVSNGTMDPETGRNHPQRNCLTSAVTGGKIHRIDCPESAIRLRPGDILILASDGLNILPDPMIRDVALRHAHRDASEISHELLGAVNAADQPDQDNTAVVVIRVLAAQTAPVGLLGRIRKEVAAALEDQKQKLGHLAAGHWGVRS